MPYFFANPARVRALKTTLSLLLRARALVHKSEPSDIDDKKDELHSNAESEKRRAEIEAGFDLFYSIENMSAHAFEVTAFGSSLDHALGDASDDEVMKFFEDAQLLPSAKFPVPYAYQEFQAVNARTHALAATMQQLNFQYQAIMGKNGRNGFQPVANYRSLADALAANNGLSLAQIKQIEEAVKKPAHGAKITLHAYHLASGKDGADTLSRHYELWVEADNKNIKPFIMESIIYREGMTGGAGSEKYGFDPDMAKPRYAESQIEILLAGEKQSADFADLNIVNVSTDMDKRESVIGAQAVWQNDVYVLDYQVSLPVSPTAFQSLLRHRAIVDHINLAEKKYASLGTHTNATSCGNYIMSLLEEAEILPRPLIYSASTAPTSVLPLDLLEEHFLLAVFVKYQDKVKLFATDGKQVDLDKYDSIWHSVNEVVNAIDKEKLFMATPTRKSFFEKYCAASAGFLYSNDDQLAERSSQQISAAMVQALLTREIRNAQKAFSQANLPLEIENLNEMDEVT